MSSFRSCAIGNDNPLERTMQMQVVVDESIAGPAPVAPGAILVATGLTDIPRLLPRVVAEAQSARAHVALLHSILPVDAGSSHAAPSAAWFKLFRDARIVLLGAARHLESHGVACSTCVREGNASEVIREELERIHASKLIIARSARVEKTGTTQGDQDLTTGVNVPVIAVEV